MITFHSSYFRDTFQDFPFIFGWIYGYLDGSVFGFSYCLNTGVTSVALCGTVRLRARLSSVLVLVLGDNPQDSRGVLRGRRHAGYTARDVLSWLLKFSRVPASAIWAGKRFHSGVVLLMKEWRSSVVELGCCLSLNECDALVRESARWRLKSSWPTATSLCIILNIRVRRWSCLRLVAALLCIFSRVVLSLARWGSQSAELYSIDERTNDM